MKKWAYIQVVLILSLGSILYTKGPKKDPSIESKGSSVTQNQDYCYTRERNYRSYYPLIRSYSRRYHRLKASVVIRDDLKKGQKIISITIDGHKVKIDGPKKDFLFRLTPGNHIIEWVSSKGEIKQIFRKKFYIDRLEQSVNLLIDENKFYKKLDG